MKSTLLNYSNSALSGARSPLHFLIQSSMGKIGSCRWSRFALRWVSACIVIMLMNFGISKAQEPESPAATEAAEKEMILEKLKVIVIPVIDFENTTLEEIIDFLRVRIVELDTKTADPAEKGVNIVVRYPRNAKAEEADPVIRSLKLKNVTAATTLEHICDAIGYRYSVGNSSVVLEPIPVPITPTPSIPSPTSSVPASPSPSSTSTELSNALSPLVKPEIESAKLVLANLDKLAANKNGAEKVAIEQVSKVIKNVFTADFNVANKVKSVEKAEAEAIQQEKLSADWMTPNAFGSVNEVAARAALVKADEIRKKATAELIDAREKLILQLRDADATILIYHKNNDLNVVTILATAILIINERALPEDAYRPSFTHAQIAALNEFAQYRDDWLAEAQNAEKSENYEKAINLYGKARDEEARKRCANFLAANLEAQKFFGSALEYYEMAGNHAKASEIRQNNPTLLADQFKVLTSDELYAKIAPCCVRVAHDNGHGSGFFFKKGGYILTNRHCVDKKTGLKVKFDDDSSLPAKIIATSAEYDLAIIKIELEEHPVIGFRNQEVKIGLSVSLVGYPEDDLPTATMNSGLVSNNNRSIGDNPLYQLDVAANHGNSGGPVVDQTGQLVGILTFGYNHKDLDKFNFAIQVGTVANFVNEHIK
jgi:S1-C subfamily serine protease